MPIYEYQAKDPDSSCRFCGDGFEVLQGINEKPRRACPRCGRAVKKVVSRCHAAVIGPDTNSLEVERRVKEYERTGKWSHAAELADKHSAKTGDEGLKTRALENYKKAGYDFDSS